MSEDFEANISGSFIMGDEQNLGVVEQDVFDAIVINFRDEEGNLHEYTLRHPPMKEDDPNRITVGLLREINSLRADIEYLEKEMEIMNDVS